MPMLSIAIAGFAVLIGISGTDACANEYGEDSGFEEHPVEFHNGAVNLAGSLLLPRREAPIPAVVFVHGAGPQTREPYREAGEYFARHGIAALIYDKRGTGRSGGAYESHSPYENLVHDALSAVAFLKQRHEIAQSQIGIWGLSQGAYISASAASRTKDIQYIIAVGASVADGTMFYYRDNLFRLYGLSDKLRDVAEKADLAQRSLPHNLPGGVRLSSFAPQTYPPAERYLHPAWSHVDQPVLAMWGQLDQNVPVGESVAGLKNSLAHAKNEKWTMLIVPRAKHSLGSSETGALQSEWRGYAPGTLKTMTDWVHRVVDDPSAVETMKQVGFAQETGVLASAAGYETLRSYGNGPVQATLWILFLISFFANTIVGVRCGWTRIFCRERGTVIPAASAVVKFKRAICALNLLILAGLAIVVLLVRDQLHPGCPAILMYLPFLGTVSALATAGLLILLAGTRCDGWKAGRRIRGLLDVFCLILFVPYMFYWNLIGFRF